VAHHVAKGDIRTYLVDRMRDTECAVSERFELPEGFRVDDYFQGQFGVFRGGTPILVVVDFDARVREFVETRRIHPSQQLEPLPNGGVRLSMTIGDLTEVTTWILGFGETARVVEPPELRDRVLGELVNALRHYDPELVGAVANPPARAASPEASLPKTARKTAKSPKDGGTSASGA
jgi:predicted DNA-binding transcriptional regulator YafY